MKKFGWGVLFAGILTGVLVALMLAPGSGRETRDRIRSRIDKLLGRPRTL